MKPIGEWRKLGEDGRHEGICTRSTEGLPPAIGSARVISEESGAGRTLYAGRRLQLVRQADQEGTVSAPALLRMRVPTGKVNACCGNTIESMQ
jgi:hypothetical protein